MKREEAIFEMNTLLLLIRKDAKHITKYYEEKVTKLNVAFMENRSFFFFDKDEVDRAC